MLKYILYIMLFDITRIRSKSHALKTLSMRYKTFLSPYHDGGLTHIETSALTCIANQWIAFCMIGTSVMKELKLGHITLI